MIRRMTWVVVGAAMGFVGAVWALAGVRRARTRLSPANASDLARTRVGRARLAWTEAIDEGRRTMHEREAALRAGIEAPGQTSNVVPLHVRHPSAG